MSFSKKLLLLRKRDTVYTRSTRGFSLWKSKVLGIGGSSLKWSKSIEKHSKKANEVSLVFDTMILFNEVSFCELLTIILLISHYHFRKPHLLLLQLRRRRERRKTQLVLVLKQRVGRILSRAFVISIRRSLSFLFCYYY